MNHLEVPAIIPKHKRKHRADEDEDGKHDTLSQASRKKTRYNSDDQAIPTTKWRRLYQKKHEAEDDEQESLPRHSSAHISTTSKDSQGKVAKKLKRKRAANDEEHGSLSKVA